MVAVVVCLSGRAHYVSPREAWGASKGRMFFAVSCCPPSLLCKRRTRSSATARYLRRVGRCKVRGVFAATTCACLLGGSVHVCVEEWVCYYLLHSVMKWVVYILITRDQVTPSGAGLGGWSCAVVKLCSAHRADQLYALQGRLRNIPEEGDTYLCFRIYLQMCVW